MDFFALPPLAALLDLTTQGLLALTSFLTPLAGAAAAALAVVLVTLVVRAALIPVGVSQARAERDRARLAPRLRVLRERWGKNPERLQRETMQLYRDAGVSPFAGCLPVLAQAPVVGLLYAVFLHS
ncbi:membrane protein insertase YidC, partial [Enterococcus casseliflavus]|uniref:membrane protein insertase YidC n=1 Tax=Enterococcus casseliflavus TaxID=37734 RepID=UPI003D120B9D